ncbi:hypothetical protein [Sphingomonas koreensis]
MRRRRIVFMLHTMVMSAPSIITACSSQAQTTPPAIEGPEAARSAGQPIKGVIVKGGQNPRPQGKAVVEAPGQPEAAAREGGTRTYTAGRRSGAAPQAAEVKAPAAPARSISEKGVE